MGSLPIQYLHLETVVLPIFLAMVLLMQLARAKEPGHYIQSVRIHMLWLAACFVLLTFAFGAVLYNVSPLLAVELAAGFTLSLLHPVNALCFCIHLLFLRPWEIATDNPLLLALPRLLAALCIFSWLIHPGQHGQPTRKTVRGLIPLLVFSFWLFLSTFQTPHLAETQADWFATYFKSLVVFAMCLFFIDSEKSISEFQGTLVISALALMLVGFYQFRSEGTASGRLESIGMFGNSNDLAAVVIIALPFAVVPIFSQASSLAKQAGGILFLVFSAVVIWYTQSRGAMLALVAQVFIARQIKSERVKWGRTLLLASLLGVGYFAALRVIPRDAEDMAESKDSRITYWKAAGSMTLHHPIWGVGFDEYPANYDAYSSGTKYEWGLHTAHSSWFLAFAESGIPGGLLYIAFFLNIWKIAWRNRKRWPAQMIALTGYAVVMSFLSHTYALYFYLLAALVLASDVIQEQSIHELAVR